MIKHRCKVALAAGLLATSAVVSADDTQKAYDAAVKAMDTGRYAEVDSYITPRNSKGNWALLATSGDAAFMRGDPVAWQRYTDAWITKLDQDWDATKGDSPIWKVLALSTAVLGMAAGYQQSQAGIVNTTGMDAIETSSKMLGSLEETTGDKNVRKNIKRVMRDLKKLASHGSNSFQIIYPNYGTVAGAGMARVHSKLGVCAAIRLGKGRYAVSGECIHKIVGNSAIPKPSDFGITIGTMLRPEDFAQVSEVKYLPDAHGDGAILIVAPGKSEVSSSDWGPNGAGVGTVANAVNWGVTWYAPEFDYLVPVFQSCSTAKFDDCGDIRSSNAVLWAKNSGGKWLFVGFADSKTP